VENKKRDEGGRERKRKKLKAETYTVFDLNRSLDVVEKDELTTC
jgi:hypothetical protein